MQNLPKLFAGAALLYATLGSPLALADSHYGTWNSDDDRLNVLLDEMQGIVDEGVSARAAHPAFLGDLQAIIDRYRVPPRTVILLDDFSDGDLLADPVWEVVEGDFRVEHEELRSSLRQRTSTREKADDDQGDPALRLLVGILGGMSNNNTQPEAETAMDETPRRAVIASVATIENRFTLDFGLRSTSDRGEARIAVTQGETLESGYHLIYRAGVDDDHPLQLIKYLRGRGYVIAEAGKGRSLDDGMPHRLSWSRDAQGQMVVSVDDEPWLNTSDQSYRGRFTGLAIVNDGGDFGFDDIELYTVY